MYVVAGAASLGAAGVAAAAPPAWCKGSTAESADMRELSSKDVQKVIETFVSVECAPNAEADDHRAEIETARQAWSKRLGMVEADWADAVDYAKVKETHADVKTKTLATASPIDQYAVILDAAGRNSSSNIDAWYAADMFDANLSEVGRFALLRTTCFDSAKSVARESDGLNGAEATWAICQPDFDRFDMAKYLSELRSDTSHGGAVKMSLRIAAYDLPKRMKEHAAEVQKAIAYDEATKKLFDIAAKARTEWSSTIGKNTQLLDLVLAMESAELAQSRKQYEGCAEKTEAALTAAVEEIPAKSFAGLIDNTVGNARNVQRDEAPTHGAATGIGLVLTRSPTVGLASIAYKLCTPDSPISHFLSSVLDFTPGVRGPRNAAIGQIKSAKLTYDNVKAKLDRVGAKPYGGRYMEGTFQGSSGGGVVKSVKRKGDKLVVELPKHVIQEQDCIKAHTTNRVERVMDSGTVLYARACDKTGTVNREMTDGPYTVAAKFESWLKPGVVFATMEGELVLAVWPNKSAKAPTMVLGAKVK
jgi:hypothetical protein